MKEFKLYSEVVKTKNGNIKQILIIACTYLLCAIIIFGLREFFQINLFIITFFALLTTVVLKSILFYTKFKIQYQYNKLMLITLLALTYVTLPLYIFNDLSYLNIVSYSEQFLEFLNNSSFIIIILININLLALPFLIDQQYKDKSTILYENEKIHLIEKTTTYVKSFTNLSDLENFLIMLQNDEEEKILPLKDFKEALQNNLNNSDYFLIIQIISFKDTTIKKIKVKKKIKYKKLENINIYNDAIYF